MHEQEEEMKGLLNTYEENHVKFVEAIAEDNKSVEALQEELAKMEFEFKEEVSSRLCSAAIANVNHGIIFLRFRCWSLTRKSSRKSKAFSTGTVSTKRRKRTWTNLERLFLQLRKSIGSFLLTYSVPNCN